MNPHYNFLFHFSELRQPEEAWAYIHRESFNDYWNGTLPANNILPIFASTQEECIKTAIERKYHS